LAKAAAKQVDPKPFIRHARETFAPEVNSSIWNRIDAELSCAERAA
jgi:hypothetical protein